MGRRSRIQIVVEQNYSLPDAALSHQAHLEAKLRQGVKSGVCLGVAGISCGGLRPNSQSQGGVQRPDMSWGAPDLTQVTFLTFKTFRCESSSLCSAHHLLQNALKESLAMDPLVESWLDFDRDEDTRREIEQLHESQNVEELELRLGTRK